jgi:hypothetical protein
MGATLTKFELYATTDQHASAAFTSFQTSLAALTAPLFFYQVYTLDSSGSFSGQGSILHGLLPLTSDAAALALLNTLNTALTTASLGTVQCVSYPVTSQP